MRSCPRMACDRDETMKLGSREFRIRFHCNTNESILCAARRFLHTATLPILFFVWFVYFVVILNRAVSEGITAKYTNHLARPTAETKQLSHNCPQINTDDILDIVAASVFIRVYLSL